MEDLKKLELLSYRPPGATKQSASTSPAAMGFNSAVIKPEMRANKVEDAGQHLQESLCRESEPEQPNKDLMIIEEIEGLMSQVNEEVEQLEAPIATDSTINKRLELKRQALEEIDLFQKTTLFKLRKAFE